ncbi:Glycerol-3-phosphate acyltransferase [subsurface metagenome]
MTIEFGLLIIGAYLLGAVPAAYLVAKWCRGIDIRQYGSGNVGASNILTVVSKRWAVPVIAFDLSKGIAFIYIAGLIGLEVYQQVIIGLAAIVGHNWPVFLRFVGGRGILTTLGVILILSPKLGLIVLVLALFFVPFRQLALGVFIALVSLPILSWSLSQPLSIDEQLPITLGYLAMLFIAMLKRLAAPPTSVTASVSSGQLLLNRLLFDRDIRDREAWIHRAPLQANSAEQLPKQQQKRGKVG